MNAPLPPLARRFVLGGALLGALVVAFGPYSSAVEAGETTPVPGVGATIRLAQADSPKPAAPAARDAARAKADAAQPAKAAAQEAKDAAKTAAKDAQDAKDAAQAAKDAAPDDAPTITIDRHGIRVDNDDDGGHRHKRVVVGLGGPDREYDSVDQFFREERGLAAMVVGIVFVVFLTPVLIVALLVWYKLRKNRMLNQTMVTLAEKGVAPTTEMLQALSAGRTNAAAASMVARAGAVEQVKMLRSQAAWSDLRKGVILAAVGLSFTAYSMLDDRSPNWVGLLLLFLGVGYGLLWYFEDRQIGAAQSGTTPPTPPGGA